MWANFTPRFDSILSDLAYHSELLGEETTTVDFSEAVSRSRQERQRWERHEREQQFSKLQSVLSWLGSDDIPLEDELEKLLRDGLPGSCDWILQHPEIQSWWKSGAENRLVWLYGKPGAGQSLSRFEKMLYSYSRQESQLSARDLYSLYSTERRMVLMSTSSSTFAPTVGILPITRLVFYNP